MSKAKYAGTARHFRPARSVTPLRIATFNVNGVNGRLPRLLEWLRETRPDVVCLQEIKTDDSKFPARALEEAGYGAVWHGQRSHHGVAILAQGEVPVEIRRGLPGDAMDVESRYLEARVKGLTVASVYLPNGNPQPGPRFDYKLAWFKRLAAHTAGLSASDAPVVLGGDFNVVPTDGDIYNAWWWRFDAVMQPETREAWGALLAQGWTDSTRHLHPGEKIYTFWVNADAFKRNAGFRMDFLLVNRVLAPRLTHAGVDAEYRGRDKPSDHAPAWIAVSETNAARRIKAVATIKRRPRARRPRERQAL
jgi:exodeoxyribonuclease-3